VFRPDAHLKNAIIVTEKKNYYFCNTCIGTVTINSRFLTTNRLYCAARVHRDYIIPGHYNTIWSIVWLYRLDEQTDHWQIVKIIVKRSLRIPFIPCPSTYYIKFSHLLKPFKTYIRVLPFATDRIFDADR